MKTATVTDFAACPLFLLGNARPWPGVSSSAENVCVLRSKSAIVRGFAESPKDSVWVARAASDLALLAEAQVRRFGDRRLLVLGSLRDAARQFLAAWFRYVVSAKDGTALLEPAELFDVLRAPNRDELLIGGVYDDKEKALVLYRGSVEPIVVPLSWFRRVPGGPRPDPTRFRVEDYGQTVRLGDYEAATDALLYEFDQAYRKKAKKRAIGADASLGGSIRRLRLQKGLGRTDFGLPERTLARIERSEVEKPREATLRRIARRLAVPLDELGSY